MKTNTKTKKLRGTEHNRDSYMCEFIIYCVIGNIYVEDYFGFACKLYEDLFKYVFIFVCKLNFP